MLPLETDLTVERLRFLFDYEPATGILRRKISRGCAAVGSQIFGDYIKIDGRSYVTGRVIWCIHYGEWPPLDMLVDHENRIHADNRIVNMRLATPAQNSQNKAGSATYSKGIYRRDRRSSWAARIIVNGMIKELGSFLTKEEAAEAYRKAALEYHGEFACVE